MTSKHANKESFVHRTTIHADLLLHFFAIIAKFLGYPREASSRNGKSLNKKMDTIFKTRFPKAFKIGFLLILRWFLEWFSWNNLSLNSDNLSQIKLSILPFILCHKMEKLCSVSIWQNCLALYFLTWKGFDFFSFIGTIIIAIPLGHNTWLIFFIK